MNAMPVVFARIILRYLSGALVAYGAMAPELGEQLAMDQDLALGLGAILGVATEGFYAVAKRKGWTT